MYFEADTEEGIYENAKQGVIAAFEAAGMDPNDPDADELFVDMCDELSIILKCSMEEKIEGYIENQATGLGERAREYGRNIGDIEAAARDAVDRDRGDGPAAAPVTER